MGSKIPPTPPDAEGTCPTGKVRYPDEATARKHIPRIQAVRAEKPDHRAPERDAYLCQWCAGWHLTSRPPELEQDDPVVRFDGETWKDYAERLERRIKEQRDHLEAINNLRADAANRTERKRIQFLTSALGRSAERQERMRAERIGMRDRLKRVDTLVEALVGCYFSGDDDALAAVMHQCKAYAEERQLQRRGRKQEASKQDARRLHSDQSTPDTSSS